MPEGWWSDVAARHRLGSFLLFVEILRAAAPLLKTLTISYADDSIYALAVVCFGLNLTFYDYSTPRFLEDFGDDCKHDGNTPHCINDQLKLQDQNDNKDMAVDDNSKPQSSAALTGAPSSNPSSPEKVFSDPNDDEDALSNSSNPHSQRFRGALSLNAAMFGAVLLASRLQSNELVFGFILCAIELFAFSPDARRTIKQCSKHLDALVTLLLVTVTSVLLIYRDKTIFVVYELFVVFVSIICPICLSAIRKYKCTINGPWDIAKVPDLQ